jgi:hypothetical protein
MLLREPKVVPLRLIITGRTNMKRILLAVFALMLCAVTGAVLLPTTGCFKCGDALTHIAAAQAQLSDSQRAMAQAQTILTNVPMPDEVRKQLAAAIDKGWGTLKAASALLQAASTACSSADVTTILRDFFTVWKEIAAILTLFGTDGNGTHYVGKTGAAGQAYGYAPGVTAVIADPIGYTK